METVYINPKETRIFPVVAEDQSEEHDTSSILGDLFAAEENKSLLSAHSTTPNNHCKDLRKNSEPPPPVTAAMSPLQDSFDEAVKIARDPQVGGMWSLSRAQKLQLYGYYKQSTEGPPPPTMKQPSILNPAARQKYDAWQEVKTLSKDQAMTKYIQLVQTLNTND